MQSKERHQTATGPRLIFVTSPEKPAIEKFLASHSEGLGEVSTPADAQQPIKILGSDGVSEIEAVMIYQDMPLGLGHAVLCARDVVLDGPVGVILPDDVIFGEACLEQMKAAYDGGNLIAAMKVEAEDVSKYGIFDVYPEQMTTSKSVRAMGIVEKPSKESAPSQLAAVGRYILTPRIFDVLNEIPRGAGGEYQLTDAIALMAREHGLNAYPFDGTRFDCGTHQGLLHASNHRFEALNGAGMVKLAAE